MKIKEVVPNQSATLEDVEVIEKGDAREFTKFDRAGRVCNARIKDDSGELKLTLWNEDIDQVNEGDKIKITDGWVKEWNGEVQISAGRNGKIEKLA